MSDYGLTEFGFVLKRFSVLLSEMKNNLIALNPDADVSDDSVTGHQLDVVAKELTEMWELAEAVYKSRAPSSADGTQLDDIGQINAIQRLGKEYSVVYEAFNGTQGTLIPTTFRFKQTTSSYLFQPSVDATIDNALTIKTSSKVAVVTDNHDYIVSINSNGVQYTSDADATIEEITQGVVDSINAQTDFLRVNGTVTDASQGEFDIAANDNISNFNLVLTADFTLEDFWTAVRCNATEHGPIEAAAGTLTSIVAPISGLTAITNYADALPGQIVQSDQVYRERLFTETRRLGGGAVEAIKDRIINEVPGVILVRGFENREDTDDLEGRPPHSIEILVEGGDDIDIGDEIWYVKGGGIETFGAVNVIVTDSQGDLQSINFSRPVPQYVHFNITLTTTAAFPVNGEATIKENIVAVGREKFGIGDLLLIQEFYAPIYEVLGVTDADIEWDVTDNPGDTPTYVDTNIQLAGRESPLFDIPRVLITVT